MSSRESNPDRSTCRFRGTGAIVEATEAARAFGQSHQLGAEDLARLCIVVEELVANLYDHGGLTDQDEISVEFAAERDAIRVVIGDGGAAFDPWNAPRKSGSPERGGNVGIDIVRAWARYVSYSPSSNGNRLEFLVPVRGDR